MDVSVPDQNVFTGHMGATVNHHQDAAQRSILQKQLAIQHECTHRCSVRHEFGNVYRCVSSGQMHICDATCSKRMYYDSYNDICCLSKRLFETTRHVLRESRKRRSNTDSDDVAVAALKRQHCNDCQDMMQDAMMAA